jgi:hypothetical protein
VARQVWNEELDAHWRKLPWSPVALNNFNNNRENKFKKLLSNIGEEK